eukprot:4046333-Ditylum_brightwellii.AAC.1
MSTMFESQSPENLKYCLNAMMVPVFPNKAYKLQKRVIKLNNYLTEFPMSAGIAAKKLEDEEILEMDKEDFDTSSSTIKKFTETCVCYEECRPTKSKESSVVHESYSKRGGKRKAKHKASKKAYCGWGHRIPTKSL